MRLVPYEPHLLPDLTRLINAHIRGVPPGWEVTETQVAAIVANPDSLWGVHFVDDDGGVEPQETLCVIDGDTLLAAANWDIFQPRPDYRHAAINWLVAQPDSPQAVALLLNALIERPRHGDADAMSTARFALGMGWMGIPSGWPHLINSFKAASFEVTQHWVIMTGDVDANIQHPLPQIEPFAIRWNIKENALEWEIAAYSGGERIGECECWGIPPHLHDCPGYDQWTTIEWLGVEYPYHRRSVGSYLMAEQLRFQAARGIRHVMVWTETDNLPTRKLNAVFGFREGPECFVFNRSLR
jgi:GNAT superfamily N-acetyltransferase